MNEHDERLREYYKRFSLPKDKLALLVNHALPDEVSSDMSKDTSLEVLREAPADVEHSMAGSNEHKAGTEVVASAKFSQLIKDYWSSLVWVKAGFACAAVLFASVWLHSTGSDSELMQRTLREVAMNHATRLEPEYRGDTLALLDNSMQKLPFGLALPEAIGDSYELVGSRYCSLAGELAAHVKLKDSNSGKSMSLFVTSNSDDIKQLRSEQTTLEGIEVQFWREDGLFFALAQRG